MTKTCVCGAKFNVPEWKLKAGRGKFCSKKCQYENATRPSGLKYNIVKENPTWIKQGQRLSPDTEFKKGEIRHPENQWKSGQRISPATEFKKGEAPWNKDTYGTMPQGKSHHGYKGDGVGYHALHSWVRRHKGKAATCEDCGSTNYVQWANKSHEYKRELDDWLELCSKCHGSYDKGHRGAIKRRFK